MRTITVGWLPNLCEVIRILTRRSAPHMDCINKYVISLTPSITSLGFFTRPPRTQNNEIGIIHVSSPFDFPQLEFTMSFVQLAGVIKQCVKVIFDPMNNGLGRTTIPFKYYMLALSSLVMFCLYLLWLLKTVVSRLAPDTGIQ